MRSIRPLALVLLVSAVVLVDPARIESRAVLRGGPEIAAWVFHFDHVLPEAALATQVGVMRAAGPGARRIVAVEGPDDEAHARDLLTDAGVSLERVTFMHVQGPLSAWARDRYVVVDREGVETVLLPPPAAVAASWAGDAAAGLSLTATDRRLRTRRLEVYVEGGDLLIGHRVALLGCGTVAREARRLRRTAIEIVQQVEQALGKQVVVVGRLPAQLPHEHLDMFLSLIDDDTLVLGDPRLTAPYFAAARDLGVAEPIAGDFGSLVESVQEAAAPLYDELAQELEGRGFTILRIPIVHTLGDVLLTWNNAVTERRAGSAHAYVPRYGIPNLDRAAEAAWRRLGFQVHMVPSADIIHQGGAVRCTTNTLRRRAPGPASR